jgi:hypothetical protein
LAEPGGGDRLLAWLVTGSPGRVAALALELGAALATAVRRGFHRQ